MIKASAGAGAAAWTAPVIIDSLASPAAAASGCVLYFAKVAVRGASPFNCPGNGTGLVVTQANGTPGETSGVAFNPSGDKWGGAGSGHPSGCGLSDGANKIASVAPVDVNGYVKVTLVAGCFSSTTSGNCQIGGRYGTSDAGDRYMQVQAHHRER